ncbi:MAG TPA: hypothetical protein DCZ01_08230 [Elusimicrobia bacterium]|nr:MAG: hypothetical protein A2X37_10185 [Elusimicrobia bacterium GWA2_66_18]OGR77574.1 MAG: hypothetical protein A2X40_06745 [Elusimicrobia bacterium GWC2_65_9]HAZ08489.1 hypothetical protein [Elusimicrobiota bacterium]
MVLGIGALWTPHVLSQETGDFVQPDDGPGVEGQKLPSGGPQGFPGPMMRAGPGGFGGAGMRGGPMGPGGAMGPMQDPEIRKRIETEMKLRRQVGELARKYRETGAKEKDAVKAELKKASGELFDAELSNREHRAKKLQEEAARAQESVSKGKANRDKIVGRRLEQLIAADGEW